MELEFNNREIAIGVWLGVIAAVLLAKKPIRASLGKVVRSAAQVKIAISAFAMVLYVMVVVAILAGVGVWSTVLLKDTVYWFLGVGLILYAKAAETTSPIQDWRRVVTDQVGVIVILTFIMNSYTFSPTIELILVPVAVVIVLIGTVAEMKEEHAQVARLFGVLQALFGWFVLLAAAAKAIQDYSALASVQSFQRLSLPFLLTALTLPFMYLLFLYAQYDHLFVWSAFKQPRDLTRYMRRRGMIYAGFNPARVNRLAAIPPYQFMRIKSQGDFDALLRSLDESEATSTPESHDDLHGT